MTFSASSSSAKDARYRKNNARHWCEYCRIYVYNNNMCLTRHESSPQHKAAVARYVERMQREERETEHVLKSVQARTGFALPQATVGEGGKGTFYYQPEGSGGETSSKGVASKPVHLLSMKTGAGVKKTSKAGRASESNGGAVLGTMVPRAVAKQQQPRQSHRPKVAIPVDVESMKREPSDPAEDVQETVIETGLTNVAESEGIPCISNDEKVSTLVAYKEGQSPPRGSLSLSKSTADNAKGDHIGEARQSSHRGYVEGEEEILLKRADKPKHLRQ